MKASTSANSNFHSLTKTSVFDRRRAEDRFQEYRRQWMENPGKFHVADFPLNLDLESTCACNLRCPFCATTQANWGPKAAGYMRLELFKRIIDEGAEHGLPAIKLSLRGEPLLHPKLDEMVAYAKKRGILDVYFNTNATLLDADKFNRLIDAGLDRISISFEGTTKEVYERQRVGADFDKVCANIRALKGIRARRQASHPQIRIQTVLLPELKPRFQDFMAMWQAHADEVAYLDARREGPQDDHRGRRAQWACPFPWQRMTILWDGTILPCLMHGVSDFSLMALGNAAQMTISEAWTGGRAQEIRNLHRDGRAHELPACDRCSYRAMELEKRAKNGGHTP
ncbi:MAG TPA: hypothetical protein DEB40_00040 [Elusimicrobia bacterium]|nr:hypothetical protein [Elusimicrobiota bacterium]HBT60122.1 hypothetical protein [Elusimicrobiota bacterium]